MQHIPAGTRAKPEDAMDTRAILKIIYMLINDLNQTIIKPDNKAFLNCLLGDFRLALIRANLHEAAEMLLKVNQASDTLLTMTKNKETDNQQIQANINKAKSLGEKVKVHARASEELIKKACDKKNPARPDSSDGAFINTLKLIIENTPGAEKPEYITDLNKVTSMQLQRLKSILDQISTLYNETSATYNSIKDVYLVIEAYEHAYEPPTTERGVRRGEGKLPAPSSGT